MQRKTKTNGRNVTPAKSGSRQGGHGSGSVTTSSCPGRCSSRRLIDRASYLSDLLRGQPPKTSGSPGHGDGEDGAILGFPVCSSSKFELTAGSHLDSQPGLLLDCDGNLCSCLRDSCLRHQPKSVLSLLWHFQLRHGTARGTQAPVLTEGSMAPRGWLGAVISGKD